MCGIVGVASTGPMTVPMKEFFQQLLFHDVVRGHHATGVAAIDTMSRDLTVEKKAVSSPLFLEEKEIMENLFAHKHNFNIYIGHNRWATSGAKDADKNAHPFIHGDVVGVHNGSLRNQRLLDDSKDFIVDSDNLFHQLNKSGLNDTLTKTDGAFALNWYDKKDNTLNFIRNSERPLAIGQLSNGCWVWASEYELLRWLVARHKTLSWATYKEDGQDYIRLFRLEEGQHMRFEFEDKQRKLPEPRLVKKTLPVFPTQSYSWSREDYADAYRNTTTTRRHTVHTGPTQYELKTNKILGLFLKDGNNKSIMEMKFLGIAKEATSTGYVGSLALFEYQSANGIRVTTHCFCHTNNIAKDWTEDQIGRVVYGEVGSVMEHGASSYKCARNDNVGATISVCNLTETKPNRFYAYCDDDVVAANKAAKEGGNHNVVPFREQATAQTGSEESKDSVIFASETIDALQALLDEATAQEEAVTEKKPQAALKAEAMAQPVILANGRMTTAEYIETMTLNAARCCECSHPLSALPTTKVYLYRHFDRDDGVTHDYLTCRLLCNKKLIEHCNALDADYEQQYGAIND